MSKLVWGSGKKGNFSSFLDFSQRSTERICSKCTQLYVFPCPIYWHDQIGCIILSRVSPNKNSRCIRKSICIPYLHVNLAAVHVRKEELHVPRVHILQVDDGLPRVVAGGGPGRRFNRRYFGLKNRLIYHF